MENDLFQQIDGGANPASPLIFRTIRPDFANRIFVKNHYAHRAVPISHAFGAFNVNSNGIATGIQSIVGAISFGKPASYTLCNGICGKENSSRIYELNRFWMDNSCPKNSESEFIGWALRMIRKLYPNWILVSFADTAQNHTGTIYRATNWIYTGQTKPHLLWDEGSGKHGRHIECGGERKQMQRSIKHRYVWFQNKEDVGLLKYPIIQFTGGVEP